MSVVMEVDRVGAVTASRRKPKLLLLGRRRKLCKKLLHTVEVVLSQDAAERRKGVAKGFEPFQVIGAGSTAENRAAQKLAQACRDALDAKG